MARAAGLWNLLLTESEHGAGLTALEYPPLCEIMGRSHLVRLEYKRQLGRNDTSGIGGWGPALSDRTLGE